MGLFTKKNKAGSNSEQIETLSEKLNKMEFHESIEFVKNGLKSAPMMVPQAILQSIEVYLVKLEKDYTAVELENTELRSQLQDAQRKDAEVATEDNL